MKVPRLPALSLCALLAFAAGEAAAQQPGGYTMGGVSPGGARSPPPPPQSVVHGGMPGGFSPGFFPFYVDREYVPVVEREIIREVPAEKPAPAAPPPPQRKPYVIGHSYSSLPSGCMKLVQDGASYFYCSGEWYRQVGSGQYKAVKQP